MIDREAFNIIKRGEKDGLERRDSMDYLEALFGDGQPQPNIEDVQQLIKRNIVKVSASMRSTSSAFGV